MVLGIAFERERATKVVFFPFFSLICFVCLPLTAIMLARAAGSVCVTNCRRKLMADRQKESKSETTLLNLTAVIDYGANCIDLIKIVFAKLVSVLVN